jgi:hypothetical protein
MIREEFLLIAAFAPRANPGSLALPSGVKLPPQDEAQILFSSTIRLKELPLPI